MRNIFAELRASLTRNLSMTISLIVTMSVSLMLASLGLLLNSQTHRTETYFGNKLQLQVNLCTKNSPSQSCVAGAATAEQEKNVMAALDSNPEVKKVTVKTPQQNYEQAKALLGQSDTGRKQLETLGPDSFPKSYYVTLYHPKDYNGVMSQVKGFDGVGSVTSLRTVLNPLFEALSKLQWASLGTSLLLVLAAVLQVSNTIRMTAFARRREIGIMRLVGASSWHIQMPFVLESMVAALISAALAAGGLAVFMYVVVYGYLRDKLGNITTWVRWNEAFEVMGWIALFSIVLALVPTLVMTRRYLNV